MGSKRLTPTIVGKIAQNVLLLLLLLSAVVFITQLTDVVTKTNFVCFLCASFLFSSDVCLFRLPNDTCYATIPNLLDRNMVDKPWQISTQRSCSRRLYLETFLAFKASFP